MTALEGGLSSPPLGRGLENPRSISTKNGLYVLERERNNPQAYLGLHVSVEWDGYGFILRTEDHARDSIYLEPAALEALDLFRQACMGVKDPPMWGAHDAAEARAAEFAALGVCAEPRRHAAAVVKMCRSCFITAVAVELRREQPIRDLLLREL